MAQTIRSAAISSLTIRAVLIVVAWGVSLVHATTISSADLNNNSVLSSPSQLIDTNASNLGPSSVTYNAGMVTADFSQLTSLSSDVNGATADEASGVLSTLSAALNVPVLSNFRSMGQSVTLSNDGAVSANTQVSSDEVITAPVGMVSIGRAPEPAFVALAGIALIGFAGIVIRRVLRPSDIELD